MVAVVFMFLIFTIIISAIICLSGRSSSNESPPVISLSLVLKNASHAIHGRISEVLAGYEEIQKLYGPIGAYPLSGGFINTCVYISDHRLVKEAFKSSACFGRSNEGFTYFYFNDKPRGLGLQDDESKWSEIRNFTFQKLKEHGTEKTTLDTIISDEVSTLLLEISKNHLNQPIMTDNLFCRPMMNVLWRVIAGKRFLAEDTQALKVYHIISSFFTAGEFNTMALFFLVGILAKISTKLVFWLKFLRPLQIVREFLIQHLESSKSAFKEGEVNNFTDAFLQKISETQNPASMFFQDVGEQNLAATVGELLGVGAKSSSVTLQWILLFLAANPEKQIILQKEIDEVLGGRLPTLDDKKRMPYTTAVIHETMRIMPLFPGGVPHKALADTEIGGFVIRKNSLIISNTALIQNDPRLWVNPREFQPERFLSEDGLKIISQDAFIPFGIGKRSCPGKYLAQHNLFIFVASIFQKLTVSKDLQADCVYLDPKVFSLTLVPSPQNLIFSHRF